ncbi:zinc ribbon domain-containing protein [Halobaculum sp. MBLA0147]|uniref:FmdB family zinc ribbon protein n=1 Tax=Halobaculum sp. MBLA0147 TaxID=3079934 RepID=UPI0035251CAE
MGLRCLLGHDYGETRTEREREERGDELVVTETEIEECTRCGETRVVSENTEVRSLAEATSSANAGVDGSTPATGGRTETPSRTEPSAGDDASVGGPSDAETVTRPDDPETPAQSGDRPAETDVEVVIDEAESDGSFDESRSTTGGRGGKAGPSAGASGDERAAAGAESATAGGRADPAADDPSPVADQSGTASEDAEIIDADDADDSTGASDDRRPGEWPEADKTHPAEAAESSQTPASDTTTGDGPVGVDGDDGVEIVDGDDDGVEIVGGSGGGDEAGGESGADASEHAGDTDGRRTGGTDEATNERDEARVVEGEDAELLDAGGETDGDSTAGSETARRAGVDDDTAPRAGDATAPDERAGDDGDGVVVDDGDGAVVDDAEFVDEPADETGAAAEARRDVVDPSEAVGDDGSVTGDTGRWPSHDGRDEGYDATPDAADGGDVSVDGSLQPEVDPETLADEDVEFVGGTPESTGEERNGAGTHDAGGFDASEVADTVERNGRASGTPAGRAGTDVSATRTGTADEYYCPECGHVEPVGSSSMRKGDICPECMRGYIDERTAE